MLRPVGLAHYLGMRMMNKWSFARVRLTPLLALLLLAGCDQAPDGYQFADAEYERDQPNITVVTHPTLADLRKHAPAAARPAGRDLMAWSIIRPDGCEMHVVDPAQSYQPQWIGHEAAHCIWGRWHK